MSNGRLLRGNGLKKGHNRQGYVFEKHTFSFEEIIVVIAKGRCMVFIEMTCIIRFDYASHKAFMLNEITFVENTGNNRVSPGRDTPCKK